MTRLPLFPLSATLVPYGRMPLQIFEQRYLELVKSSMRSGEGFGIIRIERGAEVGTEALPTLAPIGCVAQIVDWDQLDNGLLGITVSGAQRFRPFNQWREDSGLIQAEVEFLPELEAVPMIEAWEPMRTVLDGLQAHPHVQRIGLPIDFDDAWQVAFSLVQLLPIEESDKVTLLSMDSVEAVMRELDLVLSALGGDD
ncbi:MAG: LON peptidase substrate-binding domain-containing protein [Pseudomonadota bacterium]